MGKLGTREYIEYLGKVLDMLKTGYITDGGRVAFGLCLISTKVREDGGDWQSYRLLRDEIKILQDRRNVFYTIEGTKIHGNEQLFIWKSNNPEPRIKFINKLIEKARHEQAKV